MFLSVNINIGTSLDVSYTREDALTHEQQLCIDDINSSQYCTGFVGGGKGGGIILISPGFIEREPKRLGVWGGLRPPVGPRQSAGRDPPPELNEDF